MTTFDPVQGHNVRGFFVLLEAPNHRPTRLPCTGDPPYTGEQAIVIMRQYAERRPGVKTLAYTDGYGIQETLTLAEMAEIYPDDEDIGKDEAFELARETDQQAKEREKHAAMVEFVATRRSRRLIARELDTTGDLFDRTACENPLFATPCPKYATA